MRKERLKRTKKIEQVVGEKEKSKGGAVDKVYSSDTWARMKSRQGDQDKSVASSSSSWGLHGDPRLSALTALMGLMREEAC